METEIDPLMRFIKKMMALAESEGGATFEVES